MPNGMRFEFDYANQIVYCRPLRMNEDQQPVTHASTRNCGAGHRRLFASHVGDGGNEDGFRRERSTSESRRPYSRGSPESMFSNTLPGDQAIGNLGAQIKDLFGVTVNPPEFIKERGQITCLPTMEGLSWTWCLPQRLQRLAVLLICNTTLELFVGG